jgi:hypothetical protein
MKKLLYVAGLLTALASCKDEDVNVFDKSADERAAEAIASLKQELVAPADGWKIKYRPEAESGSFYVLMDFDENNKVTIKTDLGAENGEYFEQTITYRIDNSLGLELILENYSFFSFLFEQDQATFGAEYEFNYVNKTPDNALVFSSKTDEGVPTILLFEKASPTDDALLGVELSANLNALANDFKKFTSSLTLTYENKDLAMYISLDERRRTLTVTSASLKTNTQTVKDINFSTPYLIQGDSIVFDQPLQGSILGSSISIRSLQLNEISEGSLAVCSDPIAIHSYSGVTSQGDNVVLETGLVDVSGNSFAQLSDFYFSPLVYIFDNGTSVSDRITTDIAGAVEMHLYYGYEIGDGTLLYGIGFVIQNPDGTVTFALREFTPVLTDNNIVFNFEPEVSIFGDPTTANVNNVNIYLDALTAGDKTYVFELNQGVYEFYNPCSGWSFVFINANR